MRREGGGESGKEDGCGAKQSAQKARGERIGRDVNLKVIQAVKPKQFSQSAGARGLTTLQQTAMAIFTHDGVKEEQLIYFEADLHPLVLAAQRCHHDAPRKRKPAEFNGSKVKDGRQAVDRRLKRLLDTTDVDAFDTPAYAQLLNDGIVKYRKSFVSDADAVALLATIADAGVQRHMHYLAAKASSPRRPPPTRPSLTLCTSRSAPSRSSILTQHLPVNLIRPCTRQPLQDGCCAACASTRGAG